ncbi:MAG: HAMP domain-containing sensor histidine kinase [Ignavibacteria bacterium]|jgi:signal transduction histidine kinase
MYTITKRTAATFLIIISLMVGIGIITIVEMNKTQNNTMMLVQENKKSERLVKLKGEIGMLFMSVKDYAVTGDEMYYKGHKEIKQKIKKEIEILKDQVTEANAKKKLIEIETVIDSNVLEISEILSLNKKNGSVKTVELIEEAVLKFGPKINPPIEELLKQIQSNAKAENEKVFKESKEAFLLITVIISIAVIISILVVIFTLNYISKPILKLVAIAQRIAARDFDVNFKAESKDEIGLLIKAFNAMAEEIRKRYEELENFSNIAAHDLKSPLTSIMGSAQFLLDNLEDKLDEDEKILLKNILSSGENMSALITDLLEFAKAGKIEFDKEPQSMSLMLERIQKDLDFTIKKQNVKLTIQKNLPSFICDSVRFPEVWENLISNAIKYNDKPEPTIEIGTIKNKKIKNEYYFYVKDNGIGIEAEYLDKIFNTFQRATTDRRYEGTGIGLAIVKRIIEFHNGKIWAESKKGEGSTFYFTIPKMLVIK